MAKRLLLIACLANIFVFTLATRRNYNYRRFWRSPRSFPCSANEIWTQCPDAVCAPKTCEEVGYPVPCVDLKYGRCPSRPGCICKEGFVKNYRGICIPMEFCPSCGGDPNARSGGGIKCDRLCSNYQRDDVVCTQEYQYNACECKRGFVYDEIAERCVLPKQCTRQHSCKRNEVYDLCPCGYPFRTCGINDTAISCTPALEHGHPDCPPPICRCKDGFYRNHLGECVTWEECPTCKKPNEVYDACPAPCPERRCGVEPALILCETPPQIGDPRCEPGCRCIDGFVKNQSDICIPKDDCPIPCGGDPNAITGCGVYCNQRCRDVGTETKACILICYPDACDCAKGYYLDENTGLCVLPDQCTPQCPINEIYSDCIQGNCSPQECSQLGFSVPCPRIDPEFCEQGCICKEGFVRNDEGVCIPAKECPTCKKPNEVYDACPAPCPERRCGVEPALILCETPPQIGDPRCEPGCRCIDGFVKNQSDICIPKDDCPIPCGGDPNAITGCGVYCNQRCRDVGTETKACILICYPDACDCAKGYYLDENTGLCVLPDQCTPQCPINEIYSDCIQGNCSPQECSQLGFSVPCPRIDPEFCEQGCICKEGFVRNDEGVCIPAKECPTCKKPNEVFDACPAPCPERRCGVEPALILCETPPQIGDSRCEPGCRCIDGFVKNQSDICIPKDDCPIPCGGDPNAVSGCGVYCNQRCRDVGTETKACILICYPDACDCAKGYYLDENTGLCVLPDQCTPQCPINEIYSDCIQGNCSPQECSQLGFSVPCPRIDPEFCEQGCICKEGFVRNDEGVCIPAKECPSCGGDCNKVSGCGVYCNKRCSDIGKSENQSVCVAICNENACDCRDDYYLDENTGFCVLPEECTQQCPENEEYSECAQGTCNPQNCSQVGFPVPCSGIDSDSCEKSCICKEGFARNDDGICVPITDCPSCKGDPNQVPGCGVYCNQRCRNIGAEPEFCIDICYQNSCNCREGYFLDENTGFCVFPEDCTPQCPPNEFYSNCIQGDCKPQNCSQLGFPVSCPRIRQEFCKEGCLCKEGFARNDDGVCVPTSECPSCAGDENKVAGCGVYCNQRCRDIGKEPSGCIEICYDNSCNCQDGFYLDDNTGFCVLPEECTPQCPENEWYSECTQANCSPENCSQVGLPMACPAIDPSYCQKGCLCKEGFARDKTGICILTDQCPQKCPLNEVFSTCANGGCQARNCSQYGTPVPCIKIDPDYCVQACVCKENYLRASNGICIPEQDCPEACNGPNTEYKECSYNCPPQTCASLDRAYVCPIREGEDCRPICGCKPGYFKNLIGQCITEDECRRCMGSHEYYSCGGACDNVCANLHEQSQDNCPIVNIKCNEMCYCEAGYARASNNTCIPISSCESPKCPLNEVYSSCIQGSCTPKSCSELGSPVACPRIDPRFCKKGCLCKEGFVRNDDGVCIPTSECPPQCRLNEIYSDCIQGNCKPQNCSQLGFTVYCPKIDQKFCQKGCICKDGFARNDYGECVPTSECPSCAGDKNQVAGCGVYCNQRCRDIGNEPAVCIAICYDNSCNCRKDHYLDENTGFCVLPQQCTPQCPANEWYSACTQANCSPENCSQVGLPIACPAIDSRYCNKGCLCKQGFARDKTGICIPVDQCPGKCPVNEVWSICSNGGCQARNCSQYGTPVPCIKMDPKCCRQECVCKDNYLRASNGVCIPEQDCPGKCLGPHEYYSCGGACDNVCANLHEQSQDNCPIVNIKCNEMCYCEAGYARASNNTCIPISSCDSSCGGDPNAKPGCGVNCGSRCRDLIKIGPCPRICKVGGCDCKTGYYYDSKQNKCVLAGQCTDICGQNEVFEDCSNPVCRPKNCFEVGRNLNCNETCVKGCTCQRGYVRDNNGICIPANQCPTCGGDPNAQLGCGTNCGRRCPNNYINPRLCPRIACIPELNRCDCKDGFFFDINTQSCVKLEDCSPQCDASKNEVYDSCVNGGCGWRNCSQVGGPILCIDPIKCYKGCKCKDGYYRTDDGICVPENQCPQSSCGGDPNAQPGCGFNCGKRCPNNYIDPNFCARIRCIPDKCDCKDGFYFDINIKRCVRKYECSPLCNEGNNEIFDPHPPICPPQTCDSLTHRYFCPFMNATTSNAQKGECRCKPNFYRNQINECIFRDDCLKCTGLNEYFSCGSACDNTCDDPGRKNNCPIKNIKCEPRCYCKDGYVRNDRNICIPVKQCPQKCSGPNEYFICGPECDNVCAKLATESKDNCPIKNKRCNNKCYCQDGFARNENGICIPINECPGCGCETTTRTSTTCVPTAAPVCAENAVAKFKQGNQALALQFLYYLLQIRPTQSFMASGISLLMPLAQLCLQAEGETLEQLLRILNLDSKDEVKTLFPILLSKYMEQRNVTFEVVSKYYSGKINPFSKQFIQGSKKVFNSDVQSIDFSRNIQAAATMNKWVEDNTNGLIKNLISPSSISEATRCVLISAVYFWGEWKYPFNKANTVRRVFYVDEDTTTSVDTMYQKGTFEYGESKELDCKILKMPYKGGNFSILFVLPNEKFGLPVLMEQMLDSVKFAKAINSLSRKKVKIYIPVINIETDLSDMPKLLRKVNVTEIFNPGADGLSGIFQYPEQTYVSEIIQKTVIKLNERGTEATAATAIMVGATAAMFPPPEEYIFDCNRPFAFILQLEDFAMFYGIYSGLQ